MNLIVSPIKKFISYYQCAEEFIINDESNPNIKVKKKMAVYYCHYMVCYFILLPFFNPYVPVWTTFSNLFIMMLHFLVLRSKNYSRSIVFFLIFSLFGLYLVSKSPGNFLRTAIISMCHHTQAFLVTKETKKLRILFIILTVILVNKVQGQFDQLVQDNNLLLIIDAVKSLQYSWPLLYIFNHVFSNYLAEKFGEALEESQKIQEELKDKNHELAIINNKLKNTLSLLEQTNKELNEALKARELFIATVSHELRNPLNSMLGNIELLSLEVNDSKWVKMLDNCKICGEVLLGLINNVLDAAKINAERLELNFQPTNFYRLIEKIWVVSTIKLNQKGLKGSLRISKDVPKYIEMDSHRMNQILLNLIGNATKFTKTGFVKVIVTWHQDENDPKIKEPNTEYSGSIKNTVNSIIKYDSPTSFKHRKKPVFLEDEIEDTVELDYQRNILKRSFPMKSLCNLTINNFVIFDENNTKIHETLGDNYYALQHKRKGLLKIEVIDSGCGISESANQRLFQAFSQADSSITRRFGGTGLGLYITKQLINKMGGEIYLFSQENIGSDFLMTIPCQTATKEETETNMCDEENKQENGNHERSRVLIVDDDPLNQMIMTNYFHKMNIQTEVANNGQEALFKFKTRESGYYSLITMDIQMPIMDGLTACKEIRRYEKDYRRIKTVPVAIVTANCMDIDRNQWLDSFGEIKASFVFRKPFTFEECKSCVGAILAQSETDGRVPNRRMKVLIVDDDSFNTMFLKQCLEKYFFECETCGDGREAITKASNGDFNVVLMDCNMPHVDGYTATRHIRRKFPNILIIGVTGESREDCLKKAKASGMNDIETKPINFKGLVKTINDFGKNFLK